MILEIQHETRLEYSAPVTESIAEVRMEPATDPDQTCRSFHLAVSPPTGVFRYQDGFGNRVHHFNVTPAHLAVRLLAASIVETHPRSRRLEDSTAILPVDISSGGLEVHDFLQLRGPVKPTPLLDPLRQALQPEPKSRIAELVARCSAYIHAHFQYAPHVTLASSHIEDALKHRKGVCQDFTHLLIALLRGFGVPARYVSGYVHRPGKDSQSHAWCEVWLPDLGWTGMDPTNNRQPDDHFVKVAIGRDFSDVPPNKGVYRGEADEVISVRVETRTLEALPSMAWQEQLPPLSLPLTAIVASPHAIAAVAGDDPSQQQQQQQQ